MNTSGEAVRGLVKSRLNSLAASLLANFLAGFAREDGGSAARSPAHESRQLRRLVKCDKERCNTSHHLGQLQRTRSKNPGSKTRSKYTCIGCQETLENACERVTILD